MQPQPARHQTDAAAAARDAVTYKPQTARPQPTKTQAHTQPDHHHLSKQFPGPQDHS
jgi:hypothetical protein